MIHRRSRRRFPALPAAVLCAAATLTTTAAGVTAAPGASAAQLASVTSAAPSAGQGTSQSYNGLALTPPMGFNSWYQYRCNISESVVLATAQAMVSSGLAKLGYQYVNIDDCWEASARAADGELQADPTRFPHGIAWLADQVHAMGLKLGIYESVGTTTCEGYPGSLGHYQQDADTFASWGVDFVKFDYCGSLDGTNVATDYEQMSQALLAAGRPMVFSGEMTIAAGDANSSNANYLPYVSASSQISNMWRVTPDSYPNFDGTVFGHFTEDLPLASYAHPGAWNDLDMLATGGSEFQWTVPEEETQMSIWSEMASPLLVSSDLADMSASTKMVLSNRAVIAVDQDPLGKQGQLVAEDGPLYTVAKPLAGGDVAVLFVNTSPVAQQASTTAQAVGLPSAGAYGVSNLWTNATRESAGAITATVPPSGTVMYRVSPLRGGVGRQAPATDVSVAAPAAQPGQTITVPATFTNDGRQAVTDASLSLRVPSGWKVSGAPARAGAIPSGGQLSGSWQVTVPAGTQASYYTTTAVASYRSGTRADTQSGQDNLEVGDALAGYTTDEFGVSQDYPPYASQLTPLYRDVQSDGTQTLLAGSAITVGSDPSGIAVTPNGEYAYEANERSGNVDVIDTATNTVAATIPVGSAPEGVVIAPDGQTAYVADSGSNNVDVIDTATNTVTATIPVGSQPGSLAMAPDGATAYVSNQGSATVTPIDTATNTAGPPIPVGTDPQQIAITPDGSTAYVADMGSANVTPIDTATNTAGPAVSVSCAGPNGATIDPATSTLYVTCFGASGINPATYGAVVPISTATNQPGTSITVSAHPQGIVADSSGSTVYAADAFQSTLTPINAATGTPETPIHVPGAYGIALLPAG
jgi:alpha-galactosidase